MERTPTGAGPDTTGIEEHPHASEQPQLFEANERHDGTIEVDPDRIAVTGIARAHHLGPRRWELHTRDHPAVRGDRLEGTCTNRNARNIAVRWRPQATVLDERGHHDLT